jgi:NAD(P)-dependent dehydrogenase (short-subunit alcohol dehydrogenase family)
VSFDGDFYRCSRFRLGVRLGERRPKVVVGALNPRMLALAGEVADGVLLNYLPASHVPWSVEQVRAGEATAGRSPGDVTVYGYVHVGVCERGEGIDLARRDLFSYAVVDAYAANFERAGFRAEVAAIRGHHAEGDRDGALAAVSDAMVDAIDVMGDADHVHATVQAYADAGVDVPVVMPLPWGPDRMAVVDATLRAAIGACPRRPAAPLILLTRLLGPLARTIDVMELDGAVCVVTGGGNGIGAALARRFAAEGAAGVVVADLDVAGAEAVAASLPAGRGFAVPGDVTDEAHRVDIIRHAVDHGGVDVLVNNAGRGVSTGIETDLADWQRVWEVNVLAHVLAARAVLPAMLERGRGHLLNTASAAGLLVNLGDAPYTATKHAAVGFAEWLSVTYRHRGIGVSCLCPMGVDTDLLRRATEGVAGAVVTGAGDVLSPEEVAGHVVEALAAERFLVLPHPEVARFWSGKAADIDGWLGAMNRVQQRLEGSRP